MQIWPKSDPSRRFAADKLFPPSADNAAVYDDLVAPVIRGVVDGYNATVFAYGQSSSGKTHTMLGTQEDPGVMQRAVEQIFGHFSGQAAKGVQFLIRVSYFEIYQEQLKDLLLDVSSTSSLFILSSLAP